MPSLKTLMGVEESQSTPCALSLHTIGQVDLILLFKYQCKWTTLHMKVQSWKLRNKSQSNFLPLHWITSSYWEERCNPLPRKLSFQQAHLAMLWNSHSTNCYTIKSLWWLPASQFPVDLTNWAPWQILLSTHNKKPHTCSKWRLEGKIMTQTHHKMESISNLKAIYSSITGAVQMVLRGEGNECEADWEGLLGPLSQQGGVCY